MVYFQKQQNSNFLWMSIWAWEGMIKEVECLFILPLWQYKHRTIDSNGTEWDFK